MVERSVGDRIAFKTRALNNKFESEILFATSN